MRRRADASAYSGAASSPISGCTANDAGCDSAGYWLCDDAMMFTAANYASDVAACSEATYGGADGFSGDVSEAMWTTFLGDSCCSDATSVCGTWDGVSPASAVAPGVAAALVAAALVALPLL